MSEYFPMQLTWHIIKKDIRRFWPMSLFLAVMVALETWCGARLLGHEGEFDPELFSRVNGYAGILVNLQMLVTILITAALIQEDSLVGSSSYWMTRPISNRRLLAAKCGTAILLVALLPALIAIPWWVHAGLSPGDCVRTLLTMTGTSGAIALFTSPFALVTPNLGRFLLSIFVCLLAFAGLTLAASALGWQRNLSPGVAESRAYVSGWIIVLVTLAVFTIQLRPRRTSTATNVLACGLLTALIAMVAWPWALPRTSGVEDPNDPVTQAITLRATEVRSIPRVSTRLPAYRLNFEVVDVPRDYFVTGGTLVGQRLVWPDLESEIRVTGRFGASPTVPQAAALLGLEPAPAAPLYNARLSRDLVIQPSIVARFHREPGDFEMKGRFSLHTPSLRGEVPLQVGATIAGESNRTRIVAIEETPGGRTVVVSESRPSPIRSRQFIGSIPMGIEGYSQDSIYSRAHQHYLVNRRVGRFIEAAPYPGGGKPIRYCSIAFVEIFWRELAFTEGNERSEPEGLWTTDELTFASLASQEIATFERKLVFPSSMFPLPPSAETRDQ